MALNLVMALAISAVAAAILTIVFNYLYRSPVAMRLRARSKSTNNDEHEELAWLLNNEAGQLLVRAALHDRREDPNPAAAAFFRQLSNAWNAKYPDSPVTLGGYSADQFHRETAGNGSSLHDRHEFNRMGSPGSRGRHQVEEFARHTASNISGPDPMPFLSP